MKRPPYSEIISLEEEREEYARLCNGKSKKFNMYTDWENHIKTLLADFGTPQDLYNFKHYCINAARTQERAPDMYLSYIGLVIPLYLDKIWDGIPAIFTLFCAAGIVLFSIMLSRRLTRESYFFRDVIDIIETLEKQDM